MSKTKFLGIPAGGNRAGWIEMEGGSSAGVGGGGVFNVKFVADGEGNCTADKTFEEIVAATSAGLLVIAQFWEKHPDTGVEIRSGVLIPSAYLDIPEAGHIREIVFSSVNVMGDEAYVNTLRMNKDNGALFSTHRLMTSV